MKDPLGSGKGWRVVESVDSTQRLAAELLRGGEPIGAVLALSQTGGVGRFGRAWHSPPGTSLAMTLILSDYKDHPAPQYIGMAAALAAASAMHCQLAWPNDLMLGERKLGGILTEIVDGVPLVGIGANLDVEEFPEEIAERATSLKIAFGGEHPPQAIASRIVAVLRTLPEPDSWSALAPIWSMFDRTPGKKYRLPSGEDAVALGIGGDGRLLCSVHGESHSVMAAEALFG
jgi:BirA family biotin operon repressor/biotin-[acetyl-CoA-carboxylase] ligase